MYSNRMYKRNKIHIFFPNTTALILCNSKGSFLKTININEVANHIKNYGNEKLCIKCLNIYLKEGKTIKEINLDNFEKLN